MGAGASSGVGGTGLQTAVRGAGSTGQVSYPEKSICKNGSTATVGSTERVSSVDYPSPKHARHVVIQAADPKASKGQKGGFMDKLRQMASNSNSPSHSPGTSRVGSRAGSVAGDHIGSEKSQMSTRASRRDEYDVDSDDEDLEGFIYDDESTSEDEREDYVNAFSRKKKLQRGDDYSDYEGAAVRALTAGTRQARKSSMRRSRSSTEDDGDDEWDAEEEQIAKLRLKKRQEERAKAAARSAASSTSGPARNEGDARAAGTGAPMDAAGGRPQAQPCVQLQSRLMPQPPAEPPARGSSSSVRRTAAGAAAGMAGCGAGLTGPGSGPSPGPGTAAAPAAAGRGVGLRAPAPPPPPLNLGASASSQYWQTKRSQVEAPTDRDNDGSQGLSRLEQLAALQKKRQAQQEQNRGGDGLDRSGGGGGVRWQVPAEPRGVAAQTTDVWEVDSPGPGDHDAEQPTSLRLPGNDQDEPFEVPGAQWRARKSDIVAMSDPVQQPAPHQERPKQEAGGAAASTARPGLEGVSFMIKHLQPPSHGAVSRAKSGGPIMVPTPPQRAPSRLRPGIVSRGSDLTDFDVDEVLNSFAPASTQPEATQQQLEQQQEQEQEHWADSRPQPSQPQQPQPSFKDFAARAPPEQKRSIRAVKSDFVSMRANDEVLGDDTDLTARILSLPAAASRPLQAGANSGPAVSTAPPVLESTSASPAVQPAAVSRFARLGANMLAPGAAGPEAIGTSGGGCRAAAAAQPPPQSSMIGGVSGSPVRRPRRCSNQGGEGGVSPVMQTALSAQPGECNGSSASSGGCAGVVPSLTRLNSGARGGGGGVSPRTSIAGGDSPLSLPALQPSSGSSGGGQRGSDSGSGSILSAVTVNGALGRSRFGAVQHQQLQQEVLRSSAPVIPVQRNYDSDSALTRATGPVIRSSWNGGNGIRVGSPLVAGAGYGVVAGPTALAAGARSRLGQVGA